jgi:hypothetical protein
MVDMLKWIDTHDESLGQMWAAHKEVMEYLIGKKLGPYPTVFIATCLVNRHEIYSFAQRPVLEPVFYEMIEAIGKSERMKAVREILRKSRTMRKWFKDNHRSRPPDMVRRSPDLAADIIEATRPARSKILAIMERHDVNKATALLLLATLLAQYQLAFRLPAPVLKADVAAVWDFCVKFHKEKFAKN